MNILKSIGQLLGAIIWTAMVAWFFFQCGKAQPVEPKIPTIIEIQLLVGAEPDGIVGPETVEKWQLALNNQYAARYFTPSGGPQEVADD